MALVIHWYDFICLAIVAGAATASLWVLLKRDGDGDSKCESLLVHQNSGDRLVGSSHLWMSCWKGVHPQWLLASRGASGVVMAGILAWDIRRYGITIFVYYTEWTFSLVIIYFALGTVISAHGCWTYSKHYIENEERSRLVKTDFEESKSTTITSAKKLMKSPVKLQSHREQEVSERNAGFWGYVMQTIYQTCAGAVMLTDIVFWCLLVPFLSDEHFSLNMLMACMHSLNAVFLLLDTALSRMQFPWFRLAYFVLWSGIYVIFQWVLHACGFSWWPYPFLELATPWAPLWYLCLALVHIPSYGLYALIADVKNSIFSKLFPHSYIRPC